MKTRGSCADLILASRLLTLLSAAPQLDFGDQRLEGGSEGQGASQGESGQGGTGQTDNKIFFGNNALNNVALGAAAGVGGLLVTQQIINNVNSDNSNNNCNCGPSRRRRQINLGASSSSQATQQQPGPAAEPDTDQKLFGLFGGGGGCNCDAPASVEFGADCKVRAKYFNPRRPPYYICIAFFRADHKATTTTDVAAAATLLAASSHLAAGGGGRQALTQPRPRPRRWRTPRTSSSTSGALTPPSRGRSTKTL